MNQLISSANVFWESLGQAILHSFWQGFVIMGVAAILLRFIKSNLPGLRYWVAVGGILTFFTSFLLSLIYFLTTVDPKTTVFIFNSPEQFMQAVGNVTEMVQEWDIKDLMNPASLVYLWLVGFVIFSIRLMVSYGYVHFIGTRASSDREAPIYKQMVRISRQMGIRKTVELRFSDKVSSIFTYGNLRPVIIWPLALINALSPEEIDMVLAHELAHIKRNDYIVKLFIGFANTILYYHPAIWWLNWVVNNERECACDLQAMSMTGDKTLLATALVKLHEEKQRLTHMTANGFSDKNSFSNRIKRLFNMPTKQSLGRGKLTILLLFAGIGMFAYGYREKLHHVNKEIAAEKVAGLLPDFVKPAEPVQEEALYALNDTIIPGKSESSSAVIIHDDGVKSIKMEMENGDIKKLEVDGKEVAKEDYDKYKDDIKVLKKDAIGRNGLRSFSISGDDFGPMVLDLNGMKIWGDSLSGALALTLPGLIDEDFPFAHGMHMFSDSSFNFRFDTDKWEAKSKEWQKEHEAQMKKLQEKAGKYNEKMQKYWEQNADKWQDQQRHWEEKAREWERSARELKGQNFNFEFGDMARIPGIEVHPIERNGNNLEQRIGSQLNKDGFLLSGKENSVKLSGKYLKINGDKMPDVIFEKYKQLFEESTGLPLTKDTNIEFKMMGDNNGTRKYRAF